MNLLKNIGLVILVCHFGGSLLCKVHDSYVNKSGFDNFWNTDLKSLQQDSIIEPQLIYHFSANLIDKYIKSIDSSAEDRIEYAFVLDKDSLLIGIPFNYGDSSKNIQDSIRGTGYILLDNNGKLVGNSERGFYYLHYPFYFRNMTYLHLENRNETYSEFDPEYWSVLIDENGEKITTEPIVNAYQELIKAIKTQENRSANIKFVARNCFFTTNISYYFAPENKCLYMYNIYFKDVTKYILPQDNKLLNEMFLNMLPLEIIFKGVINNYIVLVSDPDFSTILIDTRSNKVYAFYNQFIDDKLKIADLLPYEFGLSAYKSIVTEHGLYYVLMGGIGDRYLVKMDFKR